MTIGVGNTIHLTDHDAVEVSTKRRLRIVADVIDSLRRHVPGATPAQLEDAARNLAQMYGELGLVDSGPEGASER